MAVLVKGRFSCLNDIRKETREKANHVVFRRNIKKALTEVQLTLE